MKYNTMFFRLLAVFLVVMLAFPATGLAQEYLSIKQMKEFVPDRWAQTYETKWRTVQVDAEVLLPDVNTVPILKVVDNIPASIPQEVEESWDGAKLEQDQVVLFNETKQAPKSIDGKRINQNYEVREVWRSGITLDGTYVPMSDITYEEICKMIRNHIAAFEYDPELFELERPLELYASHWFLYGYKKDVLPGLIMLQARQRVEGIPLLQHIYDAVIDHYNGGNRYDEISTHPWLSAGYDGYGEKLTHLFWGVFSPSEKIADDVPLCSFDQVIQAIEPEINGGHIRKIYEIELGYVMYNEPGVYYSNQQVMVEGRNSEAEIDRHIETRMADRAAAQFYLRPMWQVNCLWVKSPSDTLRETASYTTDERNTLDYYQLLVDAQTGELVAENTAQDRCEFPGFLSWEDVGGTQ